MEYEEAKVLDTLKGKLDYIALSEASFNEGFRRLPGVVGSRDEGILAFYDSNPIAGAVAAGNDSYTDRVASILAKYDTFFGRAFAPGPDPVFDMKVRSTVESMNQVGVAYLDPERFTIVGWKNDFKNATFLASLTAISLGIFGAVVSYNVPELNMAFRVAMPISGVVIPYVSIKGMISNDIANTKLGELEELAAATDEYLVGIGVPPEASGSLGSGEKKSSGGPYLVGGSDIVVSPFDQK